MEKNCPMEKTSGIIESTSDKKSHSGLILLIIVLFVALGTALYFVLRPFSSSQQPQQPTSKPMRQERMYSNSVIGFKATYPADWYVTEPADKKLVFFSSYPSQKEVVAKPDSTQLRISISALPPNNFSQIDPKFIISQKQGPVIDGQQSKEIDSAYPIYEEGSSKKSSSSVEIASQKQYLVTHNGLEYIFTIDPINSTLSNLADSFLGSFKFTTPEVYKPEATPSNGQALYQDLSTGFAFQYPKNETLTPCASVCGIFTPSQMQFNLVGVADLDSGNFEKDVKQYISIICSGADSGITVTCSNETVQSQTFTNSNGITGVKMTRTKAVLDSRDKQPKTTQTEEVLIALPLKSSQFGAIIFISDAKNQNQLTSLANSLKYLEK